MGVRLGLRGSRVASGSRVVRIRVVVYTSKYILGTSYTGYNLY